MIGRAVSVAAIGGFQEGVEKKAKIHGELIQSMALIGTSSVRTVDRKILMD